MVNSGTTAGQHDTPQRTSTCERPFTREGKYLVIYIVQRHEEDCTIFRVFWAVIRSSPCHRVNRLEQNMSTIQYICHIVRCVIILPISFSFLLFILLIKQVKPLNLPSIYFRKRNDLSRLPVGFV